MFKRHFVSAVLLTVVLAAGIAAGYFTFYKKSENFKNPPDNKEDIFKASAVTISPASYVNTDTLVTKKTKVVIDHVYTINGNYYKISEEHKAGSEIIGMSKDYVKKYYENNNYLLKSFTSEEISLEKEIKDKWPPNCYVIMLENKKINIYPVDRDGKLLTPQETDISEENIPQDEQKKLQNGFICENRDKLDEWLEDYNS